MAVVPIGTYFGSLHYMFNGKSFFQSPHLHREIKHSALHLYFKSPSMGSPLYMDVTGLSGVRIICSIIAFPVTALTKHIF